MSDLDTQSGLCARNSIRVTAALPLWPGRPKTWGEEGMNLLSRVTSSKAPNSVLLIRLLVGAVFLSEGIQKFLFPAEVGAGRFAKIGLPSSEFLGPFVGTFEIFCGTLVLLGLFTRFAVIPLLTIMAVAIYTTKIPILLKDGFWKMAHEARTDVSMTMGALFLLIVGAGAWSLDARFQNRQTPSSKGKHDETIL
jgi:uncharacterized membrane protein YphA (DoxX/SURF4 family)